MGRYTAQKWRGGAYLIAAVATFLVCGFWDIPQVRSYAAVMGGIALGMAAGPLIGRAGGVAAEPLNGRSPGVAKPAA